MCVFGQRRLAMYVRTQNDLPQARNGWLYSSQVSAAPLFLCAYVVPQNISIIFSVNS